ncbi:hypothetical protein [Gorillibacterium timonense]|uniref:hypothetical protein n=1 Tax=Gorillibacterium timonense TaxID=1689269 RepID=UPI00071E5BC8|nr:hypothetical protein [Gorillibacterium timonense]
MLDAVRAIWGIRSSAGANRLIYYTKKLPIVGKGIKDGIYAHVDHKRRLGILVRLLTAAGGTLTKAAYVWLLLYLPAAELASELTAEAALERFLYLFVVLSFGVGFFSNVVVMEPKRDKYLMVKLMRIPPTLYMRSSLSLRYAGFLLQFLPVLLVACTTLGASVWMGVLLSLLITSWRLAAEAFHLKLFDRTGINLIKRNGVVWTAILAGYGLAYVPLFAVKDFTPAVRTILFSWPVAAAIIAIGIGSAFYLWRFNRYPAAVDAVTRVDEPLLDLGKMMREAQKESLRVKEGDMALDPADSGKHARLTGYRYLNALFFARYRHLLIVPLKKRLMGIGIAVLLGTLVLLLTPDLSAVQKAINTVKWGNLKLIFLIAMAFLVLGEPYIKNLFYHCDRSLLRYSFYRSRSAILENYRIRLGKLLAANLLIAVVLALGILLLLLMADISLTQDWLFQLLTLPALAAFYSVHYLSLYYLFQPYSTEMNVKSPFYHVISSLVVPVAACLFLWIPESSAFAAGCFAATLLYGGVVYGVLGKYGARTFRLK